MAALVKPASQKGLQGRCGYDCEFVQPPPEIIQTDCSICLLVLREPHLISCCGHSFCRTCIDRIKTDGKNCPLCNVPDFSLMHNKGLERALKEFKVCCTHARSGCEWVDKLGLLDHHLNVNPSSNKQLEGCGFVDVECSHGCGGYFQRRLLANHQGKECPKRPYSCDYCREYASTFDDVTNNHWPECKCYPLSCPNHCTPYAIERQNLDHHVSKDCPLTVVNCDFCYAGCEVQLPRKDMPAHLAENIVPHMSQLATLNQKFTERLCNNDKEMDKLHQELKEMTTKLDKKDQEMEQQKVKQEQEMKQLKVKVEQMEQMKMKQEQEMEQLKVKQGQDRTELDGRQALILKYLHPSTGVPVQITMPDFEKHKAEWFSEPFYTHPGGYRMCLRVDANGIDLKGTHVSVSAYLMRGECDDLLKWPLLCDITVQLLSQKDDKQHHERTINFGSRDSDNAFRLTKGERAKGGWALWTFISHTDFYRHRDTYLKDGCIHLQVTKVQLKN